MVSMEVFCSVLAILSYYGSLAGAVSYDNGASCYDCQYASGGLTKDGDGRWVANTYSGFHRCTLANREDAYFVNKWKCESERCFIRKDPNGQIFRGCADQWNLPWGIDTNLNCSRQGRSGSQSIWWFCDGHLCNDGSLDSDSRCGENEEAKSDRDDGQRYHSNAVIDHPRDFDSLIFNDGNQAVAVKAELFPETTTMPPTTSHSYGDPFPPEDSISSLENPEVEEETVHGMGFANYFENPDEYIPYEENEDDNPIILDDRNRQNGAHDALAPPHRVDNYDPATYAPQPRKQSNYGPITNYNSHHDHSIFGNHRSTFSNRYNQPAGYGAKPGRGRSDGRRFWKWLWRSGAWRNMNPQQAHLRYLRVTNQKTSPYSKKAAKDVSSDKPFNNVRYTYRPTFYAHTSPNPHRSHFTGSRGKIPSKPVGSLINSGGNKEIRAKSAPAKLSIVHVGNEDKGKKAYNDHSFTRKIEASYSQYKSHHGNTEDDSSKAQNPCGMTCNGYGGIMHADPTRDDRFIQCGPGTRGGETCKCCHPYYHTCPQGTTFDHMHKVCSQAGGHRDEARKYKTIDFYEY